MNCYELSQPSYRRNVIALKTSVEKQKWKILLHTGGTVGNNSL
jgi:hypothetical protein